MRGVFSASGRSFVFALALAAGCASQSTATDETDPSDASAFDASVDASTSDTSPHPDVAQAIDDASPVDANGFRLDAGAMKTRTAGSCPAVVLSASATGLASTPGTRDITPAIAFQLPATIPVESGNPTGYIAELVWRGASASDSGASCLYDLSILTGAFSFVACVPTLGASYPLLPAPGTTFSGTHFELKVHGLNPLAPIVCRARQLVMSDRVT